MNSISVKKMQFFQNSCENIEFSYHCLYINQTSTNLWSLIIATGNKGLFGYLFNCHDQYFVIVLH